MAASEDQTEAIIFNLLVVERSFVDARFQLERNIVLRSVEARSPAHHIDGLEACRGNQPGARLVRNTSLGPGLQSSGERLVHGLFGEVQISEKAHQRGQYPAGF